MQSIKNELLGCTLIQGAIVGVVVVCNYAFIGNLIIELHSEMAKDSLETLRDGFKNLRLFYFVLFK
jgi:hypothetical protein